MSGKPHFTWMPAQLEFIRDHAGYDMTPRELGLYFRCSADKIHKVLKDMGLGYTLQKLTALHTPYEPVVAVGVRKTTEDDVTDEPYLDAFVRWAP